MSDKKSTQKKSGKENRKKKMKCLQCEFYIHDEDYCTERDIENCSRQNNINFSKCENFLINNKLVMF